MKTFLLSLSIALALLSPPAWAIKDLGDAKVRIGSGTSAADQVLDFNIGSGSSDPKIKYNSATGSLQVSQNGSSFYDVSAHAQNFLINGAFDYWQRGTSLTIANGVTSPNSAVYLADHFWAYNGLGSGGILTYAQHAGTSPGSIYAADVHVSTAPGSSGSSGINLVSVIDNQNSQAIYNQTASFGVSIKAQGNVNQVTLAIGYNTSEAKPTLTNTIATATCTVSSSSFTSCALNNVALGTTPTTAGVYFVSISATGVSGTGTHVTDSGNGFYAEQAMLNLGQAVAPFRRAGGTLAGELQLCQRYFQSSFPVGTTPTTSAGNPVTMTAMYSSTSSAVTNSYFYRAPMRATPSLTLYDPGSSNTASFSYINTSGTLVTNYTSWSWNTANALGFSLAMSGLATSTIGYSVLTKVHFAADAEI